MAGGQAVKGHRGISDFYSNKWLLKSLMQEMTFSAYLFQRHYWENGLKGGNSGLGAETEIMAEVIGVKVAGIRIVVVVG